MSVWLMKSGNMKIYLFCCSSGIDPFEIEQNNTCFDSDEIKIISLPCSGKADLRYIVKAFETGADGAAIVTCKEDECQHLEGNLRAQKRAESVNQLLEEVGLGSNRVKVIQLTDNGMEGLLKDLAEFRQEISELSIVNN